MGAESHTELELRYLATEPISPPQRLGALRLFEQREPARHVDHYFDTAPAKLGGRLRKADCSLRLRERADGSSLITFKRKLPDGRAGETRRRETEIEHSAAELPAKGAPVKKARKLAGSKPLRHLYSVENVRTDTVYAGPAGEILLSSDELTYPDGSRELRVELELVRGPAELLEIAGIELRRAHPRLRKAGRGKRSEARRRLQRASVAA
jgi:hypothetical protein